MLILILKEVFQSQT